MRRAGVLAAVLAIAALVALVLLGMHPEAVGRWRARACIAEESFYSRYLYEAALATPEEAEKMARHTAYNVCSQLTHERLASPSWIKEREPSREGP